MPYPEHEKLKKIVDRSQACGEFLTWLQDEKRFWLCQRATDEEREAEDKNGFSEWDGQEWGPAHFDLSKLLAEFFGIDQAKLEAEKDQMLANLRSPQKKP